MLTAMFLAAALRVDVLGDLIRSSAKTPSFSAVYSMNTTTDGEAEIRLDFEAPDKLRLERRKGSTAFSTWCVGNVLGVHSTESGALLHGSVDCRILYAELAPIETLLVATYPDAPRREAPPRAMFSMRWWFDDAAQKANFAIDGAMADEGVTPLGWLVHLRDKAVELKEDGGLLRFETDAGAFRGAIRRSDGFLEEFSGRSPNGEMHLKLASLVLGKPIDPQRFAMPAPVATSRDVSLQLLRSVNGVGESALRRRFYAAVCAQAETSWTERVTEAEPIVRALYTRNIPQTFQPFLEDAAKKRAGIAEHFEKLATEGKTLAELKERRERELGFLAKRLDEFEVGLGRLSVPSGTPESPRASELLELEKSVALEIYQKVVREPSLSALDAALAKWK